MISIPTHLSIVTNDDGTAILDIPNGKLTRLNTVGGYVWRKLEQGKTVKEIVRDLSTETNADPTVVEQDVIELIEDLTAKKLLQFNDAVVGVRDDIR